MELFRQEYWSGLPFPFPGDLPDPGIEARSPALQADSLSFELPGKPNEREKVVMTNSRSPGFWFSTTLNSCFFPLQKEISCLYSYLRRHATPLWFSFSNSKQTSDWEPQTVKSEQPTPRAPSLMVIGLISGPQAPPCHNLAKVSSRT